MTMIARFAPESDCEILANCSNSSVMKIMIDSNYTAKLASNTETKDD